MAGGGGGDMNGAPQGTEYTLQGVMRFLQAEWHRHERERNIWEIERAEMKSRIGRLEGDVRTSKRMHESLGKHVRLLEAALKKEREKNKLLLAGEKVVEEPERDPKEIAKENLKNIPKYTNIAANLEGIDELRHEAEREKSRVYLNKCLSEVSYHVLPGTHPPPDVADLQEESLNGYSSLNIQQHPSYHDPYGYQQNHAPQPQQQQQSLQQQSSRWKLPFQQQQQQQQQQQNIPQPQNQSRYGRRPSDRGQEAWSFDDPSSRAAPMIREISVPDRRAYELHSRQIRTIQQQQQRQSQGRSSIDQQRSQENISPTQDTADHRTPRIEQQPNDAQSDENEGWNFDEPQPPSGPMHRPDVDAFPSANLASQDLTKPLTSPTQQQQQQQRDDKNEAPQTNGYGRSSSAPVAKPEDTNFEMRFALRGHLDVIRCVIFTGGGSPSEPEICTCGDDMTIKRWVIPASYGTNGSSDVDVTSYFTHRGHAGAVTCLAACPPSPNISSGGRALGDGWIFSGGQDGTVKVWERGRVDAKASLEGHTDAVWSICVLPGTAGGVFGARANNFGGPDKILLASAAADGTVRVWAVSAPPQINSPQQNNGRGRAGGRRSNSISSGSNFPSSPQPSTASQTPFHYSLIHSISRPSGAVPTCISALSATGTTFAVSYADSSIVVYDTRTGEEVVQMKSTETDDGSTATGVNSIITSIIGIDENGSGESIDVQTSGDNQGATGNSADVQGTIIGGYEDRYIRLFDANSGQYKHAMLAHPAAISSLSLSPDGQEFVSGGHDAGLRFWSLEKRSCTQEITNHRSMGGEGVCSVVWSQDGRWVVSGGGDGVVKVFSR